MENTKKDEDKESTQKQSSNESPTRSQSTTTEMQYGVEMQSSDLMKLFEDGLKDIYWVEKALTNAIPKMIGKASSEELVNALQDHLEETENHVLHIEQVFEVLGKKATTKKCVAMEGIIKEGEEVMNDYKEGAMLDAGIIASAQKVEHYEISSYGTLRQYAETLDLNPVEQILSMILEEEKAADEKLTGVAVEIVHVADAI